MTVAPDAFEAVVLCRSGPHPFAVLALEVENISDSQPGAFRAIELFGAAPEGELPSGKTLMSTNGALLVDSAEVWPEPVAVLHAPGPIRALLGGALRGFIMLDGTLWPLLSLNTLLPRLSEARP